MVSACQGQPGGAGHQVGGQGVGIGKLKAEAGVFGLLGPLLLQLFGLALSILSRLIGLGQPPPSSARRSRLTPPSPKVLRSLMLTSPMPYPPPTCRLIASIRLIKTNRTPFWNSSA